MVSLGDGPLLLLFARNDSAGAGDWKLFSGRGTMGDSSRVVGIKGLKKSLFLSNTLNGCEISGLGSSSTSQIKEPAGWPPAPDKPNVPIAVLGVESVGELKKPARYDRAGEPVESVSEIRFDVELGAELEAELGNGDPGA